MINVIDFDAYVNEVDGMFSVRVEVKTSKDTYATEKLFSNPEDAKTAKNLILITLRTITDKYLADYEERT